MLLAERASSFSFPSSLQLAFRKLRVESRAMMDRL
jgi:hypothetical protein